MSSPAPAPAPAPAPLPENGSESDYSSESEPDSLPSVKKQKVNSEDGESSDFESLDPLPLSDDESCCEYDLDELAEEFKIKDEVCYNNYFQQLRESEGFDIKDYPGALLATTVFPMRNFLVVPTNVERLKGYATTALEQYNKKSGTEYEVNEILKVNGDIIQDFIFYITLSVKNGENAYFQVKAVSHINNSVDFPIVRPRAKGGLDI